VDINLVLNRLNFGYVLQFRVEMNLSSSSTSGEVGSNNIDGSDHDITICFGRKLYESLVIYASI